MTNPSQSNGVAKTCRRKPHREDLAPGEVLCNHCTAKCCRYFALPIDTPDDVEGLRLHPLVPAARPGDRVRRGRAAGTCWSTPPASTCGADNLCGIYETRPQICRDYTTDNCEYEDDWVYDHYWETAEQVEEYAEAVLGPRRGRSFRSSAEPKTDIDGKDPNSP